jgi:hypothetical protein
MIIAHFQVDANTAFLALNIVLLLSAGQAFFGSFSAILANLIALFLPLLYPFGQIIQLPESKRPHEQQGPRRSAACATAKQVSIIAVQPCNLIAKEGRHKIHIDRTLQVA